MTVSNTRAARRQSVSLTDPAIPVWGIDEARELQVRTIIRRTGRPVETSRALADLNLSQVRPLGGAGMSRLTPAVSTALPAFHGTDAPVFEALTEALIAAAVYAGTAADLASIHDRRSAAHGIRCAAACIANAAGLLEELQPAPRSKAGAAA